MHDNSWIDDYRYDAWKTSPPDEPEEESACHCERCKEVLGVDDYYFDLEGDILCEECAADWFEAQRNRVTLGMAYGN